MALRIGAVLLLLLVMGYWSQRKSPVPASPNRGTQPRPNPVGLAQAAPGDTTLPTNQRALVPKPAATASSPRRTAPPRARQSTASTKPVGASPAPATREAVRVGCDQLILRSGELVEVTLSEIGVTEIRYTKCHWPQGPTYVVLKAEVLSIRFANGEMERFTNP